MSISAEITRLQGAKTALAGAIGRKGVAVPDSTRLDGYATLVEAVNVAVGVKDVNFYDFDGSLVAAWTLSELATATALPHSPAHTGLTAQGWNRTLAELKAANRKTDVGQMYMTDDGKTRLHIHIAEEGRMTVPLYFTQTVSYGVSVDWGDGSAAQTLAGTGIKSVSHAYAAPGDYTIAFGVADGCRLTLGSGSSTANVMGATANANKVYSAMLRSAHIGSGVQSTGKYAFQYCQSLSAVTLPRGVVPEVYAFQYCTSLKTLCIPTGVTSLPAYMAYRCTALTSVCIPEGVTAIAGYVFNYDAALERLTLPDGLGSIGTYAFASCPSLREIHIPSSVAAVAGYIFAGCAALQGVRLPSGVSLLNTGALYGCSAMAVIRAPAALATINASAFANCYGAAIYDFSDCAAVPALANTSAFSGIPSDCVMRVPSALIDEWKAAANWTGYASRMVAV